MAHWYVKPEEFATLGPIGGFSDDVTLKRAMPQGAIPFEADGRDDATSIAARLVREYNQQHGTSR